MARAKAKHSIMVHDADAAANAAADAGAIAAGVCTQ